MSDVLDFAGVSVVRGGSTLLDSIDWQIEEGERWVVLGPNGAGKTTLLQLASARMHPTKGSAGILSERLGAVDVFELRPRIGLASSSLADRIPGSELVRDAVVTASYGIVGRWREQYERMDVSRARRLLGLLGAEHLSERTYGTLSEGERKRVLIARALMTDPELMLLDEPAAGLDLAGREDLVQRLGEIAQDVEAPALVLVTHHVEEIPPGFTDVLLLRGGRVVAAGPITLTLTQTNLEETFGIPLTLERHDDRWAARARVPHEDEVGPWNRPAPQEPEAQSAPGAHAHDGGGAPHTGPAQAPIALSAPPTEPDRGWRPPPSWEPPVPQARQDW